MARTIWKYTLAWEVEQELKMPPGADLLSAQLQNGKLCLWAAVDPDREPTEVRRITIVETGQSVPERILRFIDTVQQYEFVWHVFEG